MAWRLAHVQATDTNNAPRTKSLSGRRELLTDG
jgi:hypothetical protein